MVLKNAEMPANFMTCVKCGYSYVSYSSKLYDLYKMGKKTVHRSSWHLDKLRRAFLWKGERDAQTCLLPWNFGLQLIDFKAFYRTVKLSKMRRLGSFGLVDKRTDFGLLSIPLPRFSLLLHLIRALRSEWPSQYKRHHCKYKSSYWTACLLRFLNHKSRNSLHTSTKLLCHVMYCTACWIFPSVHFSTNSDILSFFFFEA